MKIFFFVFLLTFIAQFYSVKTEKQYWWRTVLSFIPLFLFMALRKDYGLDEIVYHSYYDLVQGTGNIFMVSEHMEAGYAVLNKIMPSYQALVIFSSFLSCWAFSYTIYSFVPQKYSWLAIILLFLTSPTTIFFMISGIRNGIAASLLMLSCYFIKNHKPLYFAVLGAIATSIHTSALFMFVVCYFLGNEKPFTKKDTIIWSVLIVFASFASLSALADVAMPIISLVMGRYEEQVVGMAEIADQRGFVGFVLGMALSAGLLLYLNMINQKSINANPYERGFLFKYKYALFYSFSFCLGMLGGRMGQYLIYFFIVSTTSMFANWKSIIYKYGYIIAVLYLYRMSLNQWLNNPDFHYSVYSSILGDF